MQLLLRNPAWDSFLQRVVRDICHSFGVDVEESRPHCELSHLLLTGTDSQYVKVKVSASLS